MSTIPDDTKQAVPESQRIAGLWKECADLWRNMNLGFGHPVDLWRWGWMRALEHRALGHWLRSLEALVRRAILTDALSRDVPAPRLRRRKYADRRCAPPASPADMPRFRPTSCIDPTTWKVSFRMSTRPYDPTRPRGPRKRKEPAARRLCRAFACRIEALRRAISYREDYVMRHARRLARFAEARRAGDPIFLPLPNIDDPPERQPIRISAAIPLAPPVSLIAEHEIRPRNAKHIEPGSPPLELPFFTKNTSPAHPAGRPLRAPCSKPRKRA
jgi:hypothetical protein